MLGRTVDVFAHQFAVMRVAHQRNDRERNADRQNHLSDDQRLGRVLREPQHHQRRNQRDDAARPHRSLDMQQTMHDLRTGICADRRGAQTGRQQSDGEDRADHRTKCGRDGMLRALDRIGAGHAVQRIRGEDQQRQIHRAGQQQRPRHIDFAAMQQRFDVRLLLPGGVMVVDQRGMQVDGVRHHRRAQHRRGHQHRRRALETRNQTGSNLHRIRRIDEQARDEAERDHQQQRDDHLLEQTVGRPLLEDQQHRGHRADDAAADEQRQAEQQLQRDRAADHLGQIGGDGDHLRLHEEHVPAGVPQTLAQNLRKTTPRHDAQLGGLVLDEHAHAVRQHQHPHQQVSVGGARSDVRRHVARIDICHGGDERRAEDASERVAVVLVALCLRLLLLLRPRLPLRLPRLRLLWLRLPWLCCGALRLRRSDVIGCLVLTQ